MGCLFVLNITNQHSTLYLITCAVVFGTHYNCTHRYYYHHFIDEEKGSKAIEVFTEDFRRSHREDWSGSHLLTPV